MENKCKPGCSLPCEPNHGHKFNFEPDMISCHTFMKQAQMAINHLEDKIMGGDIYQVTDEVINADDYFLKPERIYSANPDSLNFPLATPLYFAVDVAERQGCDCPCPCPPTSIISVTQTVWDDPEGNMWRRLGTVTKLVDQDSQVEWHQWKRIGDCNCGEKFSGPIEFFISNDGNDTDGDGLSWGTALATWKGFKKKYLSGGDSFDANHQNITINFGPGRWNEMIDLKSNYFYNSGNVIINGAGMDQTVFTNHSSFVFMCTGSFGGFYFIFQNFSLENYSDGFFVAGCRIQADNIKFKTHATGTPGDAFRIHDGGKLSGSNSSTVSHTIYFENYRGRYPFFASTLGQMQLTGIKAVLSGQCSWTDFIVSRVNSFIFVSGFSYQGTGTGRRFTAEINGVILGASGNKNFFPGSIAGVITNGGIYY